MSLSKPSLHWGLLEDVIVLVISEVESVIVPEVPEVILVEPEVLVDAKGQEGTEE